MTGGGRGPTATPARRDLIPEGGRIQCGHEGLRPPLPGRHPLLQRGGLLRGARGLGGPLVGELRRRPPLRAGADPGGGGAVPLRRRQPRRRRQAVPLQPGLHAAVRLALLGPRRGRLLAADGALLRAAPGRHPAGSGPAAGTRPAAGDRPRPAAGRVAGPHRVCERRRLTGPGGRLAMSDALSPLGAFGGTAPLFPLPDLVLFPAVVQPLHIFEPRYRQLMADALAGDRLMALALLKPGWEEDYQKRPPIHPVVCLGRIFKEERLPDGRYNLLLHGLSRARVREEIP